MRLTVLGSGAAFGSVGANASYCLDGRMLVDCGGPVHQSLPRAGLSIHAVRTVLLTHFHYDHVAMLPLFLGARALASNAPEPLRLAGPAGSRDYILRLLQTGYGGHLRQMIEERLHLEDVVLADGDDVQIDEYRVRAGAVVHSTGPSLAYAVTGPDGATVGFSGDSIDCAGLRRTIAACDLFVCECTGWDAPVPSHLWSADIARLIADHPRTRFLLSHLLERRPLEGALVASDLLGIDVFPAGAELPAPPASLAG